MRIEVRRLGFPIPPILVVRAERLGAPSSPSNRSPSPRLASDAEKVAYDQSLLMHGILDEASKGLKPPRQDRRDPKISIFLIFSCKLCAYPIYGGEYQ